MKASLRFGVLLAMCFASKQHIHADDRLQTEYYKRFVDWSLAAYNRTASQRETVLRDLWGPKGPSGESVVPWDLQQSTFLWDLFPPVFNCPFRERLGRASDGGKWICNPNHLTALGHGPGGKEACHVISAGIKRDVSFEVELIERTNCIVHTFDPTIDSLPSIADKYLKVWDRCARPPR